MYSFSPSGHHSLSENGQVASDRHISADWRMEPPSKIGRKDDGNTVAGPDGLQEGNFIMWFCIVKEKE